MGVLNEFRYLGSVVLLCLSACGTEGVNGDGRASTVSGQGGSLGATQSKSRTCLLETERAVLLSDLLAMGGATSGADVPVDVPVDVPSDVCELACSLASDEIAENTGEYQVLDCEVDESLLSGCLALTSGGAAGVSEEKCEGHLTAARAQCAVSHACSSN